MVCILQMNKILSQNVPFEWDQNEQSLTPCNRSLTNLRKICGARYCRFLVFKNFTSPENRNWPRRKNSWLNMIWPKSVFIFKTRSLQMPLHFTYFAPILVAHRANLTWHYVQKKKMCVVLSVQNWTTLILRKLFQNPKANLTTIWSLGTRQAASNKNDKYVYVLFPWGYADGTRYIEVGQKITVLENCENGALTCNA